MILALDSVFEHCSVALLDTHANILAIETKLGRRQQTQHILPMIADLLKSQHCQIQDLTAIAFNRGPGAFSGIRINTAVAQAFGFAHDLPCLPVSSLQAIAQTMYQQTGIEQMYSVIDARMEQVYFAPCHLQPSSQFAIMQCQQEMLLDYGQTTEHHFPLVGDGATLLTALSQQTIYPEVIPDAGIIGKLGVAMWQNGQGVSAENALPTYLRHNAWKNLAQQQKT